MKIPEMTAHVSKETGVSEATSLTVLRAALEIVRNEIAKTSDKTIIPQLGSFRLAKDGQIVFFALPEAESPTATSAKK